MLAPLSPHYLPLPSCHVLLHPVLGQLFGLHVLGVLHQPWVLKALGAVQTVSDGGRDQRISEQEGTSEMINGKPSVPGYTGHSPGLPVPSSHTVIGATMCLASSPLGLDCTDWTQPNHWQILNILESKRVRVTSQTNLTPCSREVCHSVGQMGVWPFCFSK